MSITIVGNKIHFGGYVLENRDNVTWIKGLLDANADYIWGKEDAVDTKGREGQDEESKHASETEGVERSR